LYVHAIAGINWRVNSHGFNHFIKRLRTVAAALPDCRTADNSFYSMADIALSAFSVFFCQCPSFLSYQQAMEQARGRNNARSLFGVERIPCDNHIRQMLDPVEPSHLLGLFDDLLDGFEATGALEAMRAVHGTRLIALDGTWYFSSSSKNIHCQNCSHIKHSNGQLTHYHSAITPLIVSPGHSQVVPLRPEFIVPQDGNVKQDCEIAAAKRWVGAHAQRYASGNDTLLGDDLYAHQPFCRQALLHGFHFLFTCKPDSHAYLTKWVQALEPGRDLRLLKTRVKGKGNRWEHYDYQWANGVPLAEGADPLKVNWCQLTLTDGQGAVIYRNSWVTDWAIDADNVAGLAAAGRARWKIENENNNVLKNHGYHLEHNFGHGKEHLASLLATMNLLAFGLHTLLELTDENYRLIRNKVGARRRFFRHLEALTTYLYFESWEGLMDFMMRGLEIGPYTAKS
jgi:hypothetical protein